MRLKGIAGSQGEVVAVARVISSLDQIGRFSPGEILVTEATSPAWTPLIHAAAAVVTEKGGALCHAAIVAREYGIPAVVGLNDATRLIADGSKAKVDGAQGTVEIL